MFEKSTKLCSIDYVFNHIPVLLRILVDSKTRKQKLIIKINATKRNEIQNKEMDGFVVKIIYYFLLWVSCESHSDSEKNSFEDRDNCNIQYNFNKLNTFITIVIKANGIVFNRFSIFSIWILLTIAHTEKISVELYQWNFVLNNISISIPFIHWLQYSN